MDRAARPGSGEGGPAAAVGPWLVAVDGVSSDPARSVVPVLDRGFLYGDGVFETVRSYGERLFELDAHLARLAWSAERLGIRMPLQPDALAEEVRGVCALARHGRAGDVSVRIMLTRGEGALGLDPALAGEPRRVVIVAPWHGPPARAYREGVAVVCERVVRPSDSLGGAKVLSYLPSIVALGRARARGAHEAVLVSHEGFVLEGTTSNVFVVCGDVLATPPLDEPILPGVTRRLVIEAARALGIGVEERRLVPEDLAGAHEAFLTSTLRELLPVVGVDGFPVGDGAPGPTTRRIHEAFRARAGLPGPPPWHD